MELKERNFHTETRNGNHYTSSCITEFDFCFFPSPESKSVVLEKSKVKEKEQNTSPTDTTRNATNRLYYPQKQTEFSIAPKRNLL